MEIKQAIKFKELVKEYTLLCKILENIEKGHKPDIVIMAGPVSANLPTLNDQIVDFISERASQLESIIESVKPVKELENF